MIKNIIEAIFAKANEWHNQDMTVFEWQDGDDTIENAAIKLLYHNYQTWHLIDLYKSDPSKITHDSHGIPHNKLRNYAIVMLDEMLSKYQKGTGKMHSETLGDIIDKISILYIKLLHLGTDPRAEQTKDHLYILVNCAEDLFAEMQAGTRQCPMIQRFKV